MTALPCPGCEGTVLRHEPQCLWTAHEAVDARRWHVGDYTFTRGPVCDMDEHGRLVPRRYRFAWLRGALYDAVVPRAAKYVVTAVDEERGTITVGRAPR